MTSMSLANPASSRTTRLSERKRSAGAANRGPEPAQFRAAVVISMLTRGAAATNAALGKRSRFPEIATALTRTTWRRRCLIPWSRRCVFPSVRGMLAAEAALRSSRLNPERRIIAIERRWPEGRPAARIGGFTTPNHRTSCSGMTCAFRQRSPEEQPEPPLRAAIRDAHRRDESAADARSSPPPRSRPTRATRIAATARRLVVAVRARAPRQGRDRRLPAGIRAVLARGRRADVPRRGAAAHPRRRHRRPADPRQDRRGRLAAPSRPFRLAVRQRLDLGADADRPAGARPTPATRDLGSVLRRLVARSGEPVVRQAVTAAMRILGRPVRHGPHHRRGAGARARAPSAQGYRHSYDMLGEAARTAADAARYRAAYAQAIAAIGARGGRPRRSRRRRASRSSCRRCIRATRWRSASG